MILCSLVASYRKEHRISIRALAKTIGVDHTTLWNFERGNNAGIKYHNLSRIVAWALSSK